MWSRILHQHRYRRGKIRLNNSFMTLPIHGTDLLQSMYVSEPNLHVYTVYDIRVSLVNDIG